MAKLFLAGSEDVTAERLHAALSERLSSKYAVFVRGNSDGVKVGKDALMAIIVEAHPKAGGIEFVTAYNPGSASNSSTSHTLTTCRMILKSAPDIRPESRSSASARNTALLEMAARGLRYGSSSPCASNCLLTSFSAEDVPPLVRSKFTVPRGARLSSRDISPPTCRARTCAGSTSQERLSPSLEAARSHS